MKRKVLTIEKTGKRYKALGMLAKVMGISSLFVTILLASEGLNMTALITGPTMFVTALILIVYVRVGVWWNHR